jgi:sugar/nucleoside kinase (ribokinase family)
VPTAFAFAFLDSGGEPTFEIHGEGIDASIASLTGREGELVEAAGGIAFGSNTLVVESSRRITAEICDRALESGVTLMFDPNLRPGRWDDLDRARDICFPHVQHVDVLKCNAGEARWLLDDPGLTVEEAAEALHGLGPRLVVITDGTDPVIARGAVEVSVTPPPVEVVSPLGAGDTFMGTMAAGLHATGFDLGRAEDALREAADAAARACTHLGAFER